MSFSKNKYRRGFTSYCSHNTVCSSASCVEKHYIEDLNDRLEFTQVVGDLSLHQLLYSETRDTLPITCRYHLLCFKVHPSDCKNNLNGNIVHSCEGCCGLDHSGVNLDGRKVFIKKMKKIKRDKERAIAKPIEVFTQTQVKKPDLVSVFGYNWADLDPDVNYMDFSSDYNKENELSSKVISDKSYSSNNRTPFSSINRC